MRRTCEWNLRLRARQISRQWRQRVARMSEARCGNGPRSQDPDIASLIQATLAGQALNGRSRLFSDRLWYPVEILQQWRIVFRWTDAGPEDVEIIDYH